MKKIANLLFIFFLSLSTHATNYYVSSTTGNDNNNGLSEKTALKTLSKVNSMYKKFLPGDKVLLKSGDIWKESLSMNNLHGSINNYITFSSFGTGPKPIISLVKTQKLKWENLTDNIWVNKSLNVKNPKRLRIDGIEVLGTYSYNELGLKVLDMVKFFYGDNGSGVEELFIYSLDSPENHNIEFSSEAISLGMDKSSFIKFENIEIEGGLYTAVAIRGCENVYFMNMTFGVMSDVSILVDNSYDLQKKSKNIIIDNCLFDSDFNLNYFSAGLFKGSSVRGGSDGIRFVNCIGGEIKNSSFQNWGHTSVSLTTDISNEITGLKIYNNTFSALNIPYGGGLTTDGGAHHNEVYNNHFKNTKDSQINGYNNHIHHNIFEEMKNSTIHKAPTGFGVSLLNYYQGCHDNIIENNLFIRCEAAGILVEGNASKNFTFNNIIRNNIIYECGNLYNNIGLRLFTAGSINPNNGNIYHNNLIFSSSNEKPFNYYGININASDFNKKNGDSHLNLIGNNIQENPLFVNSLNDWHLNDNSPALNSGSKPKSMKDYEGNLVPYENTLPDIGIFEHKISFMLPGAGQDQTICTGNSTTLTASGGSVYKWSTGATTKSITVSPNVTTTYSVTVSEGSVSDTDEVLVTVNPLPIADAGTDVTIESGQSTTLTATGGDTYLWSNGATTASITVNPTATTTYEVTVNKNGCSSKDTVSVTVNTASAPPATVTADAGKDQTICIGNSTTLTASGGSVYKWSTGATTKSITVSPNVTTTYSVTVSEGSVSDTDEVLVTVNPLPVADAGSNKTIELGQSVELTAAGGNTYLWSTGETTQSITVKPDKSTIYSVTVNQNGCSSGDSVQVTVNVPPPADANAGSDLTICKGESITLNGDGGATYSWSTGATTRNITVSPNRTTTYTLTASRGGTTSTDEVIVTVINCDLNNGVNNSVSGTTGNTATTDPTDQNDEQVLNKADFELTVYPNPTEGKLNVQTTVPIYNFNLVLMNINGNVIYSDEMDAAEDGINKEIDLSGFAKGLYLLQLYNDEESYAKKIILI